MSPFSSPNNSLNAIPGNLISSQAHSIPTQPLPPTTMHKEPPKTSSTGLLKPMSAEMPKDLPKPNGSLGRYKIPSKEFLPSNKGPKRQRSSRFHAAEHVEFEKLPNFRGIP
ncbi:hypothetical protein HMI54_008575 [Coelomomyces lativittatus]|nr:hypothetical protein HMI54_008575 [Coelomomyces lativittatus]